LRHKRRGKAADVTHRDLRGLERPQHFAIRIDAIRLHTQRFRRSHPVSGQPRIIGDRADLSGGINFIAKAMFHRRTAVGTTRACRHDDIQRRRVTAFITVRAWGRLARSNVIVGRILAARLRRSMAISTGRRVSDLMTAPHWSDPHQA
jgi:hypothetical protein